MVKNFEHILTKNIPLNRAQIIDQSPHYGEHKL